MEFADWLSVEPDGKLCILLLDIRDGFHPNNNPAYIGGYFNPIDLLNLRNSNGRDMIYIDTYPGVPGSLDSYMTIAHEVQHLMNFASSIVYRHQVSGQNIIIREMDLWIDEGLSSAAEFIYSGQHNMGRINWYNNNTTGQIVNGNNFFVWGNRNAVLDDYATVYIFFQWLRQQTGGNTIFSNIIKSPNLNHIAVVNAVPGYSNWETLLRDWLAANYIRAATGVYGYGNDPVLQTIQARTLPSGITNRNLFPGEGVYSIMPPNYVMPSAGTFIRYSSLGTSPVTVNNTPAAGNALLTYNISTNLSNIQGETGTVTGTASMGITSFAGNFLQDSLGGPYRIGAGDSFRQRLNDTDDMEIKSSGLELLLSGKGFIDE
jgi:hypothetical protein